MLRAIASSLPEIRRKDEARVKLRTQAEANERQSISICHFKMNAVDGKNESMQMQH